MLSSVEELISQIKQWLYENGYEYEHVYCVNEIYFTVFSKMSEMDRISFKSQFGEKPVLSTVYYSAYSNKYEYSYSPSLIDNLRGNIRGWFGKNFLDSIYIHSDDISMYLKEKMDDVQIMDFEREFGVKLKKYSISCGDGRINYEFG